jgi:hypothetical protein
LQRFDPAHPKGTVILPPRYSPARMPMDGALKLDLFTIVHVRVIATDLRYDNLKIQLFSWYNNPGHVRKSTKGFNLRLTDVNVLM